MESLRAVGFNQVAIIYANSITIPELRIPNSLL